MNDTTNKTITYKNVTFIKDGYFKDNYLVDDNGLDFDIRVRKSDDGYRIGYAGKKLSPLQARTFAVLLDVAAQFASDLYQGKEQA